MNYLSKIVVKYCYKWRQLKKKISGIPFLPIGIFYPQFWVSWKFSFKTFPFNIFSFYFYIYFHRLQCDIISCNISEIWRTHPKFLLFSLPVIKLILSENYYTVTAEVFLELIDKNYYVPHFLSSWKCHWTWNHGECQHLQLLEIQDSLVSLQWLGLCTSTAKGRGSIPG